MKGKPMSTTTQPTNPADMTLEEMEKEGNEIIEAFEYASRSDPYGWDWPTMAMTFPELVARFKELKAEWKKRQGN